jgi:hypothetical protein
MATSNKNGNEFLVNTTTSGDQSDPAIPALAGGGFVVVWQDYSQSGGDTSGSAVRGQMFSSTGSKVGSEFLVNTTTSGSQLDAAITGQGLGGFVVVWTDTSGSGGDTSGYAIRGQRFTSSGSKFGSEFLVNTTTSGDQGNPSIAANSIGVFMVVWTDTSKSGGDTSGSAIRGQRFHSSGSKQGSEFLVNTTTSGGQGRPRVAALPAGFVVVWTDTSKSGGDTSGSAVRGQVFDPVDDKLGSEFLINTTTSGDQCYPSITAVPGVGFVVVWTDTSQSGGDTSGYAIRGQRFTSTGGKIGSEFLVNTTTSGYQMYPSVTAVPGVGFVVVWTDTSRSGGDTSAEAVRGQMFSSTGSKVGSEFLVNTTTSASQQWPAITALPDGRFVVVWEDFSQSGGDTSTAGIRAQMFNGDGSKFGNEFFVNTTTKDGQFAPAITALEARP